MIECFPAFALSFLLDVCKSILPIVTSLKKGSCKSDLIVGYDAGSLHASAEIIDRSMISKYII